MNTATVKCALVVILTSSLLEKADAQPPNSFDIIRSMESLTEAFGTLSRVVENLQTKVESQADLLNNLVKTEELQTLVRNLETKADGQANLLKNFATKLDMQATVLDTVMTSEQSQRQALNNMEAKAELQETLLSNLSAMAEIQGTLLNSLEAKVNLQTRTLNNLVTKQQLQTLSKNLETKADAQATLLNNLDNKFGTQATLLDTVVATNVGLQDFVSNNLVTKSEMQSQATQLNNLEVNDELQEALLSYLSETARTQGALLSNLEAQTKTQPTVLNNLQASMDLPTTTLNNLASKEELHTLSTNLKTKADGQANVLKNLETKLDTQAAMLDTLVTSVESQSHAIQLNNLEAKEALQETLLSNLSAMAKIQGILLSNMEAQAKMQPTVLNKLDASIDLQTTTLNNLSTKEELQATLLNVLQSNVTTVGSKLEKLAEDYHKSVRPNGTVEGIIAGTDTGVVVIPLGTGEQREISSTNTWGVAFDWSTKKVYWLDNGAGIRRANLDGTSMELLISDQSRLHGIAVDPVTGNFYYGVQLPKNEIRVCGRSGQNCAVVASGVQTVGNYIYDIALYPSDGIMFWSNPHDKKTVVRANMDGVNARVIISEAVSGMWVDETSKRLYCNDEVSSIITSYDLNGNNRKVLLSGKLDPSDAAVHGDTVYFGNWMDETVYSVTQNGQLALIANTTGMVWHITLYGKNRVPFRRNPCHRSACPNVCVLNRYSFTCL